MIVDDSAPAYRPWPVGMPGWGCSTAWNGTNRNAMVAEWERWPAELRDPLMVQMREPWGFPKLWAGPKELVQSWSPTGGTAGNGVVWAGIYYGSSDTLIVAYTPSMQASTFAHEWGHLVDFAWRQRALGLPRSNLSSLPAIAAVYQTVLAANPGSALYYHANVLEFFAQCFAGWAMRERSWVDQVCGDQTDSMLDALEALLPYDGMEVMRTAPGPVARGSAASVALVPDAVACGCSLTPR